MTLSGWCHPDLPHPRDHAACQKRVETGEVACGCTAHGGHTTADHDEKDD